MARKPRTKDTDRGYKRILKDVEILRKKPFIKVGYPAKSNETNEKKLQKDEDGVESTSLFVSILDVALGQEFGNSVTKERSFIRASFDKNRNKYLDLNKKLVRDIIDGKITVEKALDILGLTLQNDIKSFIRERLVKPESQRAIEENGTTLILTSQLMNSITYIKVMNGKGKF